MITLAYRFTARRYHATPWRAHVNEGLVEWPPSPFRILRALIATGFGRLGWEGVEGAARELIGLLASVTPSYALPGGSPAHTRHYMPIGTIDKKRGVIKTTKVIDAFLHFPEGSILYVRFPTELPDACRRLLSELLRAQPYLGRAEAWVEAWLEADPPEGLVWTEPRERPDGPGQERVELLACDEPARYAEWREAYVARGLASAEAEARAKAKDKGKAFKALGKKDREKVEAAIPRDVVDALLCDTGALLKAGWSQPPGTRWVSYFRDVQDVVPRVTAALRREPRVRPTTALLALSSDTRNADALPPLADALRRLEALHDALVRASDTGNGPSPCFTARVAGDRIDGHRHTSLVPLTLGKRRDRLDHVLAHCPMGFDDGALDALSRVRKTWAKNLPDVFVTLAGTGDLAAFRAAVPLLREATTWESLTPFVPSRFLKARGRDSLLEQIQRELESRALPRASRIELEAADGQLVDASRVLIGRRAADLALDVDGRALRPTSRLRHFRRVRPDRRPPCDVGLVVRLTFDQPIDGPVLLGYASHYGLGVFAPTGGGA